MVWQYVLNGQRWLKLALKDIENLKQLRFQRIIIIFFNFILFFNFKTFYKRDLKDIIVAPCGACRQFIAEFGLDWKIILFKNVKEYEIHSVRDILPMAFDCSALNSEKF
jgi:hypothetical protein